MKFFNGKYTIDNEDPYNFILGIKIPQRRRKKADSKQEYHYRYFSNFKNCLREILNEECRDCPDIKTLIERYERLEGMIENLHEFHHSESGGHPLLTKTKPK